jgi:endoglucanase
MKLLIWCIAILAALAAPAARAVGNAFEQNKRLGRGVNVLGYDPIWRDRSKARFQPEHFRLIREAGFDHVRINLYPFRYGRPGADGKLSEDYFRTLDWAVDTALADNLLVVLDLHEYEAMGDDPVGKKPQFLSAWSQLAEHYKDRPDTVFFELLNEPHGKLTPELWNQYLAEALPLVRRTNPGRTVIVGPGFWNGIGHLNELKLPDDDRNLIVTVHYYTPMEFTHQGASWTNQQDKLGVPWEGTELERARIAKDLDAAAAWSKANRRPIYLGEFGAYDKAEMAARARWTSAVARAAEERGFSWAYWQFEGNFVVYDVRNGHWIEPIRDALIPPKNTSPNRQ